MCRDISLFHNDWSSDTLYLILVLFSPVNIVNIFFSVSATNKPGSQRFSHSQLSQVSESKSVSSLPQNGF